MAQQPITPAALAARPLLFASGEQAYVAARVLGTRLTPDGADPAWADEVGADVLWSPGLGLNGAVDAGRATVAGKGFDHLVIVHSDIPLARRRPWRVAQEVATLDHLSHGRAVLGVGLAITLVLPLIFISAIGSDNALHLIWNLEHVRDQLRVYRFVGKAVTVAIATDAIAFIVFAFQTDLLVRKTMLATVASVTSALQRARVTMREQLPDRRLDWRSPATHELSDDERGVVKSYMDAHERNDLDGLTNPGVGERCNDAIDNNCDGRLDGADPMCSAGCADVDNDGWAARACGGDARAGRGPAGSRRRACATPPSPSGRGRR